MHEFFFLGITLLAGKISNSRRLPGRSQDANAWLSQPCRSTHTAGGSPVKSIIREEYVILFSALYEIYASRSRFLDRAADLTRLTDDGTRNRKAVATARQFDRVTH